jgi:hypothetical protein
MCVRPAQEETDRLIANLETLANAADWNVQMIQEAKHAETEAAGTTYTI